MSAHLQWVVGGNCSGSLIKRNKQTDSTEPSNPKARNSFCYKGLIHCKTVGVEPAAHSIGVLVVMKRRSGRRKPVTSYVRTTINKNAWATLSSTPYLIRKNKYLLDLHMAAIHRAQPEVRDVSFSLASSSTVFLFQFQQLPVSQFLRNRLSELLTVIVMSTQVTLVCHLNHSLDFCNLLNLANPLKSQTFGVSSSRCY
ncbi:60S ribosomal protein L28-like [Molossus molossus]|uniref:60S ribosomal protein L28-like n=1 Tax=Molossus molossus TaxID=27622 RepID=UPI001746B252|nr:60S ribosomal protein L28-like [Molossus molossus]